MSMMKSGDSVQHQMKISIVRDTYFDVKYDQYDIHETDQSASVSKRKETPIALPSIKKPIQLISLYKGADADFEIETNYWWNDFMHKQFWFDGHAEIKIVVDPETEKIEKKI